MGSRSNWSSPGATLIDPVLHPEALSTLGTRQIRNDSVFQTTILKQ
jgi:hypothetical protein